MPKTSDWVVVATEGNTVDGRKIAASWIKDMAEQYSKEEYTALIWPEHYRSDWTQYKGKNWGIVEELKAEEKDGKLRLFAKLTPNQFLLEANKEGQKLFTSIEPNPDYKGEGRCYLEGLAVTDSPASTGTTLLKFSRSSNGQETTLESDALEEVDFSQCLTRFERFYSFCNHIFSSEHEPEQSVTPQPEDEEPMNKEQFAKVMSAIEGIGNKQNELEEKFNTFGKNTPEAPEDDESNLKPEGLTPEQFSTLTEQLEGIATKQGELEEKFNQLSQEVPDQRPDPAPAGDDYMPV
ncbi:capsid protein [Vibrio alginolyticus]|uniref:GPO family capsid scaffolding protein n=1 Tax=Vibrio alginolyticus TaxID=663 RepID=UPI0007997BE2|nr:GPO family capsid scaffolding protein [Vibrio alginolyticus]KXZ38510.1 capsid protein [Vibrio alginolyticus]